MFLGTKGHSLVALGRLSGLSVSRNAVGTRTGGWVGLLWVWVGTSSLWFANSD
jgi:hypothetical protein